MVCLLQSGIPGNLHSDQCSQEVKDKLEGTDAWKSTQRDQSLHELVRICIGFNDHKQEVFNLVQALKMLFLYSQGKKETVKQCGQNFGMFWETVEAFGGSPGAHQGIINALLKDPTQIASVGSPMASEKKKAEEDATESVKAALLISGANKTRFGKLKDDLANNYLLGIDQYPNTFEKAMRILGSYQSTKASRPYKGDGSKSGPDHDGRSISAFTRGLTAATGSYRQGKFRTKTSATLLRTPVKLSLGFTHPVPAMLSRSC